jgi:phage terminase large subunit
MSSPLEPWAIAWMKAAEQGDALIFATGVLGFLMPGDENPNRAPQLELWQVDALQRFSQAWRRRFAEPGRLSIKSGHGVGKTCFLCIIILFVLLVAGPDTKIPVVANSQDQLRDGLWPELAKWRGKLPPALQNEVEWSKEKVFIKCAPEEAFAVRRTATKHRPEALQGIHAETILAIWEEASGIPEETIEAGAGTLSTPGAMQVAVGNPTRRTGFFYATQTKLRERWDCMTVSSEAVPRARGHIQDIIDLFGRDSNKYRVRVLGEFPDKDDDTVIPLSLVEASRARNVAPANVWPVWGVDPGRFGDDPTAFAERRGNMLPADMLREWHGLDGPQVAGRVIALYNETPFNDRPREIDVDVIGIGASVYDHLRLPGSPVRDITRGVNVAESPAISETEYRLRDELWFRGFAWFAARDCCILPPVRFPENAKLVEKLIGELTSPTYDYTMLGKRKVESKDELKKRGVPSPNIADAFLNTLAAGIYPRDNPHNRYRPESDGTSWMSA